MASIYLWGSALLMFLLFLAWHENWRGPLKEAEIKMFMAQMEANENLDKTRFDTLVNFMRSDTGAEFFMVNMLVYTKGKLAHPETGEPVSAPALFYRYFRSFIGRLLRNGGYPAFSAGAAGDYIEAWNTAANPGWSGSGIIRYRSRRDLMRAVTDPAFSGGHIYKKAALAITYALPVEASSGLLVSPRIWVGMLLTLLAAFGQIIYLVLRTHNG